MISIHAAREGGDTYGWHESDYSDISIHAAREGGDQDIAQETAQGKISIHAAREGGDGFPLSALSNRLHFNPRRP